MNDLSCEDAERLATIAVQQGGHPHGPVIAARLAAHYAGLCPCHEETRWPSSGTTVARGV